MNNPIQPKFRSVKLSFKKKFIAIIAFIIVLSMCGIMLSACNKEPTLSFSEFSELLLAAFLQGDGASLNVFFDHPEVFGLEDEPIAISMPYASEDEYKEGLASLNSILEALQSFKYENLTFEEKMTYKAFEHVLLTNINDSNSYYFKDYIGVYYGLNNEIPDFLNTYTFKTVSNVDRYIEYLNNIKDAFSAYLDYESMRCRYGYGQSDVVYNGIIEQCLEVATVESDEHFLITEFNKKLRAATNLNLTPDQIDSYIFQNTTAVNNQIIPAYENLANGLEEIIHLFPVTSRNQLGYKHYENGRKVYESIVKERTGKSSITVKEVENDLMQQLVEISNAYAVINRKLIKELSTKLGSTEAAYTELDNLQDRLYSTEITIENADAIAERIKSKMSDKFPALPSSAPSVSYTILDESLRNDSVSAYYRVSPTDNKTAVENIFINPDSSFILFELIAHEGFPGHLYQNVYQKLSGFSATRLIFKSLGTVEGWAVYCEEYATEYFSDDPLLNMTYSLNFLNTMLSRTLMSLADIQVHYRGVDITGLSDWLHTAELSTIINPDAINANLLFENTLVAPANMLPYSYGYFSLLELKERYMRNHPSANDYDFHSAFLKAGMLDFDTLALVVS